MSSLVAHRYSEQAESASRYAFCGVPVGQLIHCSRVSHPLRALVQLNEDVQVLHVTYTPPAATHRVSTHTLHLLSEREADSASLLLEKQSLM